MPIPHLTPSSGSKRHRMHPTVQSSLKDLQRPRSDELGTLIIRDAIEAEKHSHLHHYFKHRQGRGNFATLQDIKHPARHLLRHLSSRGAPVLIQSPPWTQARKDAAVARGPHKSAYEFQEFLRTEMADMVKKSIWTVLPYSKVKHIKSMRIAPIGVVPQNERRPRPIVDYSFYGLNAETLKLSPAEAMQFGRALERIITQVVRADPRYGPVRFIKIDLADGFYRVWVRAEDVPKLGVSFPALDGEEPLIAFPLALPMGWTESPPYFCAVTETIADIANARILKWRHPLRHRLERLASSKPKVHVAAKTPTEDRQLPPSSVSLPSQRNPNLPDRQRILSIIDVFVDDFIAAAQGSPRRLNRIRRILMDAIDDVFRPIDATDDPTRREPISVSKLRQGDACWDTVKKVLGWIVDSVAMTLTLPPRRLARLADILSSIPPTQKRLALDKWYQILGELRSMSIALPASRGLFSSLQSAIRTRQGTRLRLDKGFHDALNDFRWIHQDLAKRPTRLQELVPVAPTLVGAHDASRLGAGGVWLPGPTVIPRHARVKSLRTDGTLRRHRLTKAQPVLWRHPFPAHIQSRLVTWENSSGTINNSDLELAGSLLQQEAVVQCYDVRERTTKDSTDNLATMYWTRKGSTTTTGPPAKLLRLASIHQRFHRYLNLKDYLEGHRNSMADDASRFHHHSDLNLLLYFNIHYPQKQPWVLWTPTNNFASAVTSALLRQTSPLESFLQEPMLPLVTGTSGSHSAPPSDWILPFKGSKIPSPSSKSSCTAIDSALSRPVVDKSALAQWKMPYAALAKRLPLWGPLTPVLHPLAK